MHQDLVEADHCRGCEELAEGVTWPNFRNPGSGLVVIDRETEQAVVGHAKHVQ